MVSRINVCVLTDPLASHYLASGSLCKPHNFLRHNNIEIRPVNNPTVACEHSRETKNHIPLTSNPKLEMIKLGEEGM